MSELPLMGVAEICLLLGEPRERVYRLTLRIDFPEPVWVLRQGRVWWEGDVEAWFRKWSAAEGEPSRVAG